jgi:predicted lysophospholipase L1 biosynthesis ABC-type transport system permease subunit
VLALVALAASYRPLRQALRAEPAAVLREDPAGPGLPLFERGVSPMDQ